VLKNTGFSFFAETLQKLGGRIRTAAAPSPKTGQKRACGSFLAARALPSHPRPPSKNHVKS
jgi:hypothetical protein